MRDEPEALDIGNPPRGCVLAIAVVCLAWAAALVWFALYGWPL